MYEDGPLHAYIPSIGHEMAATSERTNLPWTFRVVDDPIVNAFALPGGFIYVTRGILTHLTPKRSSRWWWATRSATSPRGTRRAR